MVEKAAAAAENEAPTTMTPSASSVSLSSTGDTRETLSSGKASIVGGPHLKRLNELMSKKFLTPTEADEIKLLLVENLELTTPAGSWNKVDDDDRGSFVGAGSSVASDSKERPASKRLSGSALLRPLQTVPISKALARASFKIREAASPARGKVEEAKKDRQSAALGSLHEAPEEEGEGERALSETGLSRELLAPPPDDLGEALIEQNLEAALDLKILATNISAPSSGSHPPVVAKGGKKGR